MWISKNFPEVTRTPDPVLKAGKGGKKGEKGKRYKG